jgi:hypothetical protein
MRRLDERITRLEKTFKPGRALGVHVADRQQIDGKPGLAVVYKGRVTLLVGGIGYDDI